MNNLWVRSQDNKNLVNVNAIKILDFKDLITIHGYINSESHFWLGTYPTKERAIEILDDIQKILTPTIICKPIVKETAKPQSVIKTFEQIENNIEIRELNTIVFEMPQE